MEQNQLLSEVKNKAASWLSEHFDEPTRNQVRHLMGHDEKELIESFYQNLEFGTGGLRGIMGPGTNRMNIYTVGMATQGFANYLKLGFPKKNTIKVAIAYDCRNNSKLFAETTAKIFSSNDIKVYLFEALRPTPELSFAVRHFECQGGIVITASHNPKEYNGYKAYWDDGGQLIAPHDKNVIKEVNKITSVEELDFKGNPDNIHLIGDEIDRIYLSKIVELSLAKEKIKKFNDLPIVYTPIHGTGVELVPRVLELMGFKNIIHVPEQDVVSGDFPTVFSPNPEEPAALDLALKKARETNAELVMGTDPDADRVGVAVKNNKGEYVLLNGNQTATLLLHYLLSAWKNNGKIRGKEYIVKTIVTTELLVEMANKFSVEYFDVLTGFKYIADIIKENEGRKTFIGGGEESYGYLAADFVRDKDAVMSCALIAETAVQAKSEGKTLFSKLLDIYCEFGFYKENLKSVVRKGKEGSEEINQMMIDFRKNPPGLIAGSSVTHSKDYLSGEEKDISNATIKSIDLPKSNVLQYFTADGSKISIRPSGTEPKIKFYIGVKGKLESPEDYDQVDHELELKINTIIGELIILRTG